jgi:inhibitor of cysteine peptidase
MRSAVVFGVVLLLAAVSAGSASAKTVRLGATASGSRVALVRGDRLQITLASNPSTGYSWRVLTASRSVLKMTASTYKGAAGRPGAGGAQTLTFRVVGRGTTRLTLVYVQVGSSSIGKRFRLTAVVR